MSRDRFTTYARIVLATNLAVIVWGAFVRATGSGAGCGSDWPTCRGEIVPREPSVETLIELTHRATSGIALVMVVVLAVWARRAWEPGHRVRLGATLALLFMFGEAALGAGIVLFELVADNASIARALFIATHLGNTFLLVAALTLTAFWASGGEKIRLAGQGPRLRQVGLALGGTLLIGMTGAVAALGDTLFPAASLAEAVRQDLSPTSHVLIQLRRYHPLVAVLVSFYLLHFIGTVRRGAGRGKRRDRRGPTARRFAAVLNVMILVQLVAGTVNILLLAPIRMQLLHLLLADLLWIALVLTCAADLAERSAADP